MGLEVMYLQGKRKERGKNQFQHEARVTKGHGDKHSVRVTETSVSSYRGGSEDHSLKQWSENAQV